MKKLLVISLLASIFIVSCKEKKKPAPVKPPVIVIGTDTLKITDDVLENPMMDNKVAAFKRKRPIPPPPPPDVPPTQAAPEFCTFLDFDGHTTRNTMWNVNGDFYCAPSGLDATQQKLILDSARSYCKPLTGIYVTNDSVFFLKFDPIKRMRVVITTSNEWYGSGSGGVAYINSSNWGDGSPCFVFSKLLGYNARYIADASAHEAAHTLGLRHQSTWVDGVKTSEYNWGNSDEAPIEGASYYTRQPKWWIGLNSLGVQQNDTLIMGSKVRQ